MFPGQGSQYVGMGAELALGSPAARAVFAAADDQLALAALPPVLGWTRSRTERNPKHAACAVRVQPRSRWQPLREPCCQLAAAFAAGHSLGEITALAAAGALKFADGLQLVCERGRLMQLAGERQPGSMAAVVGASAAVVAGHLRPGHR
ncbi:probable malonyl-CoA-acyl carrier protein transacylase, mitochondrial [Anaerolineaceae bacterium]|nr:probable malonyl-CoA-acyl carrier protein transacylase, mitochondrial [Anaerolineaceae bacterium]